MNEVYFSKEIEKLLEKIDFSKLGKNAAIKVHFGEKGCETYLNPEIARKVYEKIKSLGKEATLVECNVLYKGSRTTRKEHIETAKEHGFNFAPVDILDGEMGDEFLEFNGCKIGKGIEKYDSLIVLSHFKGHGMAGFGGALKNIGMGLGSRAGKLHMHSNIKPSINRERCTSCLECIKHCSSEAIKIESGKAEIDNEKCTGCAMCIAVCPNKAVRIPWGSETSEGLQRKIAEYASAVNNQMKNRIVYINVLENITRDCDCMNNRQIPVMDDAGILLSENIAAIDRASLDLANKNSGGKFNEINSVDKERQIDFAVELGLGKKEYKLIELD